MKAELGRITVIVSCNAVEYDEDGEVTLVADSAPQLSVEIDLPVDDQLPLAAKYLHRVADQLEAQS